MDTPDEPGETSEQPAPDLDAAPARRPRRRARLDARTVGICVCVALVVAIVAGLVASTVIDDDDGETAGGPEGASDLPIQMVPAVEAERLLAVELLTVDGRPTTLDDLVTDRPVLVNLWASNCAPCIKEMPLLEQAATDNPGLDVLGIDTQDRLDKAEVMAERTGITYPWAQDPSGDFFFEAKAAGMPTTFLFQPGSGEIVASKTGEFTSQDELQRWLDDHLS